MKKIGINLTKSITKYILIIQVCKCNLKKIKLFNIFDKEIYNWVDLIDSPSAPESLIKEKMDLLDNKFGDPYSKINA